jgi:glycosyltransferase involved in cell wall biosynthesis
VREPIRETAGLPSVSIVIPTHARTRMLAAAIESVLEQDYPRLELVLVGDGALADTRKVIERYAAAEPGRVRALHHDHMGQVRSLNSGFELARGELLGYLGDDDLLLPGAIGRLAATLVDRPDAVLAYSAFHAIDGEGEIVDTITPPEFSVRESVRLHDSIVGAVGALFRRETFERLGGWDPRWRYCPDWDFWIRARALGPFARLSEPLACYRWHDEAMSWAERGPEMLAERLALIDSVFADPERAADLADIRGEAYRNAYICAGAYSSGPGVNQPDERFYVVDRLRLGVSASARAEDPRAEIAELHGHLRRLEDSRREDLNRIRELEAYRAAAERALGRPWWRLARRLTPARLRARLRRPAGGASGGAANG